MADSRHLESRFGLASITVTVWLTRNLVRRSSIKNRQGRVTKYQISKIQDDGQPPFWKNTNPSHGNKTENINVKTVVFLQFIAATWHIENSKNDEHYFWKRVDWRGAGKTIQQNTITIYHFRCMFSTCRVAGVNCR